MDTSRRLDIEKEGARHLSYFEERGATRVETDILLDASAMLDLYGEDIRARAYVIQDPVEGELMMRPDHTVPIAQMHLDAGADVAEYSYAGPVFRKQPPGSGRMREYWQVGYENFGRRDSEQADARVLSLFFEALGPFDLRVEIGDMGVVIAAVESLSTTPKRKSNLLRHIWRPSRFRELMDMYGPSMGKVDANLQVAGGGFMDSARERIVAAGPEIGHRGISEIRDRLEALREDSAAPALDPQEAFALNGVLDIDGPMEEALARVREMGHVLDLLGAAADRMECRMNAIAEAGVDPERLGFRTILGQTTLEYYDGFVFGFFSRNDVLPPMATGGRYDFLTRTLGGGRACPGVGGVIRPESTLRMREA